MKIEVELYDRLGRITPVPGSNVPPPPPHSESHEPPRIAYDTVP